MIKKERHAEAERQRRRRTGVTAMIILDRPSPLGGLSKDSNGVVIADGDYFLVDVGVQHIGNKSGADTLNFMGARVSA